jgi:predicted acyltransferase
MGHHLACLPEETQELAMTVTRNPEQRLESLDALRGFDMFWIIGGSAIFLALHELFGNPATHTIQVQLSHVQWEGFRFWDLIMPLFLFIVGTAMPFSFAKRIAGGESRKRILTHVVQRFAILFVLGMVAQGNLLHYDLSRLHLFSNTLQAIAAGYLISALALLFLDIKGQAAGTGALLLVFWALMAWVPVPGYGAGVLNPEGNLAMYVDRILLGPFRDGTNYTWILSSLGFAATVLMGVLAGHLLRSSLRPYRKVFWFFVSGVGSVLAGWAWGFVFPIIKHLWTGSFVLFSGGFCLLLLAVFFLVIDVWGKRDWAFGFKVIGMNAIAVYMATRLFDFRILGNIFVGGLEKYLGSGFSLVSALAGFAVLWLILYFMYRRRIFLKI